MTIREIDVGNIFLRFSLDYKVTIRNDFISILQ